MIVRQLLLLGACAALAGCDGGKPAEKPPASAELSRFWMANDPAGALSVPEAKAAAPKEKAVVVGRISAFVKGHAAFKIVDVSLPYCGGAPGKMDECPTPWDYCCETPDELKAKTLFVEARDAQGQVIATSSIEGLRLLDLVALEGQLSKDEHGNVKLVTTGWYRRERPDLRDGLEWPQ
ncbi:MAG: hypothetical protein ACT4PV_16370 [Planctomycetaceae bacterium]